MNRPLAAVRVLDLTDGLGEPTARYLGELGADVVRVERPGGSASRRAAPLVDGISVRFAVHNTSKRAVELDPARPADRERLDRLIGRSTIVVDGGPGGLLAAAGATPADLRAGRPDLVVVSVTPFGTTGPYRDWVATDEVLLALSGVLARSGRPGRPPVLPPGSLATESTAVVAAWGALLAYYRRLRTGRGDHVDVSAFEATAGVIDPGYGIGGAATLGPRAARQRGRPDARHLYPIVACADGWVRICVLSPRQWRGMLRWMGDPAELGDPALRSTAARAAVADTLRAAYERHFAPLSRTDAVAQGQEHGVPTAAVLTLAEVTGSEHFAAREAFVSQALGPADHPGGIRVRMPNGVIEIDGVRAGIVAPAPAVGEHTAEVGAELDALDAPPRGARPGPTAVPPRGRRLPGRGPG